MKFLASAAFAVAAALALSASAQPPAGSPPPPKPKPSCFWANRIDNFAAVDQDNLYLRVGRDTYHLTLFSTCLDLDSVHHLALRSRSSSLICEGSNLDTDVIVRGLATGRQRCPVTRVEKLTPDQVAALPKGARP